MIKKLILLVALLGFCVEAYPASATDIPGKTATFSVAADGTPPLQYQWKKDGVDIPGATAATLVLTNVKASDAGVYTVYVSNAAGGVLSDGATLTVISPPTKATTNIFMEALASVIRFIKGLWA